MLGERVTPVSSNCDESLDPSAGSVRLDSDVPLNFWFGPKKIRTVKFLMEVENLTIDPFGTGLPQTPDLACRQGAQSACTEDDRPRHGQ